MNQTKPPMASVHAMLTAVLTCVSGSDDCAYACPTLSAKHVTSMPMSMKNFFFMKISECLVSAL